jgi:hypothetical protein
MSLHILDPDVVSSKGHCLNYDISILESFCKRKKLGILYTNKKFNDKKVIFDFSKKYIRIIPFFNQKIVHSYFCLKIFNISNKLLVLKEIIKNILIGTKFFINLLKIFPSYKNFSKEIILFHTFSRYHLFPLTIWYLFFPKKYSPKLILIFRFTHKEYSNFFNIKGFSILISILKKQKYKKIRLLSDSHIICKNLKNMVKKKINEKLSFNVAPIPHSNLKLKRKNLLKNCSDKKIIFGFLGESRFEKGFDILVSTIKKIFENKSQKKILKKIRKKILFKIQYSNSNDYRIKNKIDEIQEISKKYHREIQLINGTLDHQNYFRILNEINVVLLPYRNTFYNRRTSGIFSESMAFSKIIIAPKKSWMGYMLKKFNCGITFKKFDDYSINHKNFFNFKKKSKNFIESIITIFDCFSNLEKQSKIASKEWVKFHNPDNFVKKVIFS